MGGGARSYTGARYGRDISDESSAGSYGMGGYGRDLDYGRRGALGYGGYGGMGGAESGSSTYGQSEQHRGRGPRGYRRSDERIREDICDMLTDDPYIDASNMEVTVKECEVTLSGNVSSREDKRRAEDIAERISGVKDVHNSLRVSAEQRGMEQTGTQAGQVGQTAKH
jgi:osmotically-inducible protein OsmY